MRLSKSTPLPSVLVFLLTVAVATASDKLSRDLEDAKGSVAILVQYRTTPNQSHADTITNKHQGKVKAMFGQTRGVQAEVPATQLDKLAESPDVLYVSADRPVNANMDVSGPTLGTVSAIFQGIQGSGVTVAVIDSGVTEHADLAGRIVYAESFIGKLGTGKAAVADDFGHGTVVAGILAGDGSSAGILPTIRGIAPKVKIVSLKALDSTGKGTDSAVVGAINRAIELKGTYKIGVINLSLGRPIFESFRTDPLCQAVERAWKAGIVVVVAAGNGGRDNSFGNLGYGTIQSPGNDPLAITVGAMRTMRTLTRADDLIATYSSKGPSAVDHIVKPDLVAPGNLIIAAAPGLTSTLGVELPANFVPESEYKYGGSTTMATSYFRLSGTSMAAPMVTGTAALLLGRDPSLTPDQIKARLMKTASKDYRNTALGTDPVTGQTYSAVQDLFAMGAGYLDINAALKSTDLAAGRAFSPKAVYDSTTKTVKILGDASVIWGDRTLAGTSAIWGTSVIWGESVIWGDALTIVGGVSVIWGDKSPWADTASSGFSVIWGDKVPQSDSVIGGDTSPSAAKLAVARGEK